MSRSREVEEGISGSFETKNLYPQPPLGVTMTTNPRSCVRLECVSFGVLKKSAHFLVVGGASHLQSGKRNYSFQFVVWCALLFVGSHFIRFDSPTGSVGSVQWVFIPPTFPETTSGGVSVCASRF